jgi:hypothetical protein
MLFDRKGGDCRTLNIPRPFASLTGTVQPGVLAKVLGQEHFENGLAARLLLSMPPRKQRRWTEFDLEPEHISALNQLYAGLYAQDMRAPDEKSLPEPVLVGLSPEAKKLWIEFYDAHAAEHVELVGDLAAAWSKLEGYAARLALLFHCCRIVSKESVDPNLIDVHSMASGIAVSNWFAGEAKRVYAVLSTTNEERQRNQLVELIRGKGGSITARQLQHASRKYRESVDLAEAALNDLVSHGLATRKMTATDPEHGGRPTCVWTLT